MLLQPLEAVLDEIGRILRKKGSLIAVLPASEPVPQGGGETVWTSYMLVVARRSVAS